VRVLIKSLGVCGVIGELSAATLGGRYAIARYFVERLTAHSDVWMVKFDDEEHGPYKSQSEAVLFAIDAAEKLNELGEKAQVVIIGPTWSYDQDISMVRCAGIL
jgi:hypothetical protein